MTNSFSAVVMAAMMALSGAGCATQEDVVAVPYSARGGPAVGNGIAVLVTVEDARTEDRTRISNKINGYGMEMAAIRADRPVTDIVRDALQTELRARGFRIGPGGPQAKLAVQRFYAGFKTKVWTMDAVADVKLHVRVASAADRALYERQIDVEGKQGDAFISSGSNAAIGLGDGMTKAFAMLFDDPAFVAALTQAAPAASATPNS
jgi:uncharacterized lipoprotein YajG